MSGNAEIAKDTIEQFKKIQRYMAAEKKENAYTYASWPYSTSSFI